MALIQGLRLRKKYGAAVVGVAAFTLLAAACSSSGSSPSGTSSSGTSGPTAGFTVPASAIPASGTPDLHGLSVTFEDIGNADVSRVSDDNVPALLKQWGANANLVWQPDQQIAVSAMLHGSAQVLISTIADQLPAVQHNFDIRTFGVAFPRVDYVFAAGKNITSISQLKGKSIGVLTGGPDDISWVLARQALETAGIPMSQVNVIKIGGQTSRTDALISGRIQASALGHATLPKLAPVGIHTLYDFTQKDTTLFSDMFWASPTWLKNNPKLAVAINLAALDTFKWFNDPANKTAVLNELVQGAPGSTMADAEKVYSTFRKYNVFPDGTAISDSVLAQQQKFYADAGTVSASVPLSQWATSVYDQAALKAYMSSGGS